MHAVVAAALHFGRIAALDLYQPYVPVAAPFSGPASAPGLPALEQNAQKPRERQQVIDVNWQGQLTRPVLQVVGPAQQRSPRNWQVPTEGSTLAFSLAFVAAFFVSGRRAARRPKPRVAVRASDTDAVSGVDAPKQPASEAADEELDGRAAQLRLLQESYRAKEKAFLEMMKAAAAEARSPAGIADLKTAGETIAASLRAKVDANANHPIAQAQASRGERGPGSDVFDNIMMPFQWGQGNLSLIGEAVKMETVSLGGFDLHDPEYFSEQCRVAGCAAVAVRSSCYKDSLGEGALKTTVEEQEDRRGEYPGPIPVVLREPVVDEIQLAAAKADGANAVVLQLCLNGAERTKALMDEAAELGLETLVRVATQEELDSAVALGAKIVAIGDCLPDEAENMIATVPSDVIPVADIPFQDVRGAWMIRDRGFKALFTGRSVFDICVRDRVPPKAVMDSMTTKGSVEFGLGMQKGRLEGSKENLGTLAM
jgi:hypothetical protein